MLPHGALARVPFCAFREFLRQRGHTFPKRITHLDRCDHAAHKYLEFARLSKGPRQPFDRLHLDRDDFEWLI